MFHAALPVDSNASRDSSDLQRPLENFRARTKRVKLHPRELAVVWLVGAHLVFLPWALGAMWPWAHWTSLAFSVVAFGLTLLPRNYVDEQSGAADFKLHL